VTVSGSIKRHRDDLINKAVGCWLNTNSHHTECYALRCKMHLRHGNFQVVKHYPEQFLVIFSEPPIRQSLLDRGVLADGVRDFHFAPWSERRNATNTNWEYRAKVRIEGMHPGVLLGGGCSGPRARAELRCALPGGEDVSL